MARAQRSLPACGRESVQWRVADGGASGGRRYADRGGITRPLAHSQGGSGGRRRTAGREWRLSVSGWEGVAAADGASNDAREKDREERDAHSGATA